VHAKVSSHSLSFESSAALSLFKQLTALLQTTNCRKAWGKQLTGTEQGSPYCSVRNSHKCPANTSANRGQFAEQTMLTNNSVALCLIMVQRDGEKRSWITSGGHTLIGNDWHPFGVLEADNYCQNYHWQFGNFFLFINYIFMKKNEFKLL
jgi:hypothetical protein